MENFNLKIREKFAKVLNIEDFNLKSSNYFPNIIVYSVAHQFKFNDTYLIEIRCQLNYDSCKQEISDVYGWSVTLEEKSDIAMLSRVEKMSFRLDIKQFTEEVKQDIISLVEHYLQTFKGN